jgi:hypothetical protein
LERRKSTYNSPYAGPPQRAAPWPWIAGTLIVICFLAASGILTRAGLSHADDQALSELTGSSRNSLASAEAEPTETPVPTETPAPTATIVDTDAPNETADTSGRTATTPACTACSRLPRRA